ncbi:hypothetical protein ACKGJO_13070 [Gracilimonas sp. Q87]|uniref:hypothetical protein n=1 Tax=Gracilimonas sp. Q87 TaxID=3384766 RepID=UPI0039842D1E
MIKSENVSNTFWNNSFLGITLVILSGSALFVLFVNRIWSNIQNDPISLSLAILFVLGIFWLIIFPHWFRVVRTMRFLDIAYLDQNNMKFTIRGPVFANEILNPDDIYIKQITSITQDKIFSNLMEFTFDEEGEQKKITSFIKREKVNFIRNLSEFKSA